ncbi:ABC transporter substrate-binding protein [Labrys wisconsinensis]|uniref:Glycerol transport system substrate-binding protein n=1 Tax=Labrys wisconsinensis TaxID=425677 RepID=A0ABU0JKI0_9HYPH|nr:ABC transporter substrate-binding protein [Labrys wisconsinensis]MDQ0474784.1 glycerol transport system substrate-binding protein [Labrys wisconsinensis]
MRRTDRQASLTAAALALLLAAAPALAGEAAAEKWIDGEFQPSTLSRDEQLREMGWFIKAAEPYRGMEINIVSETLVVHEYESKVLAKAFEEITGIKVRHDLVQKSDVVETIRPQPGKTVYDGWIGEPDVAGPHVRDGPAVDLTDWMAGEGKDVTDPGLDVDDFIGRSFAAAPDGHLYQLPDQQSAILYWFRYDWFTNPDYRARFKARYGYELGVPVTWSAYEDIAEFFTKDIGTIDGVKVYGHMDFGGRDPWLGRRFAETWLPMAGNGDRGPPVGAWGIRMAGCSPVGSDIARGGGTNGAAAVYALTRYLEWLKSYAPPNAGDMTFSESGRVPAQGAIAQQLFWSTAFSTAMLKPGLPVMNADGTPKWRVAPSPHGAYWMQGMRPGSQDMGSLTLLTSTPLDRRKAAWLYLQFIVSRTVSLKKSHVGLTFIRASDIRDASFTERAPRLGGLIEVYRSPARLQWPPAGAAVPDYPELAQLWSRAIGDAASGARTPREAMDGLAAAQDSLMAGLEASGVQGACGPRLNPRTSAEDWHEKAEADGTPAPRRRLENEKPRGETVDYDKLIRSWSASPPGKS